jgi:hypothetical protein
MEKLATARSDESVVPGTNPGKDRHAVRCKCYKNPELSGSPTPFYMIDM